MKRMFIAITVVLGLLSGMARQGLAQEVALVVNDAAPNTSVSASQLAQIYQKQLIRWSNGLSLEPVDLAEGTSMRERFSQMVFDKTTAQVKAWWQTQLFSGRSVPPIELTSDARVVEYVQLHAGAIGYVSSYTPLPVGVRRLRVTR